MSNLKVINFIGPSSNKEVLFALVDCILSGFEYTQTREILEGIGFYIPKDQFLVYKQLISIQIDLDIGSRQNERG